MLIKYIKIMQIGKQNTKLFLSEDTIVLKIDHPKDFTDWQHMQNYSGNNRIQQNCKTQVQHTKIDCISIY
jgi:hypothetical protein